MEQQAEHLAGIIAERWGDGVRTMLDIACGIGTQSIGLATKGFAVTASDLSAGAIERAQVEARRRGVAIAFSVCDMRAAHDHHGREFDVVIACDNAIPHLLSDDEILLAFWQMRACTRPGDGCLVTVRDYDRKERGAGQVKPYGVRARSQGHEVGDGGGAVRGQAGVRYVVSEKTVRDGEAVRPSMTVPRAPLSRRDPRSPGVSAWASSCGSVRPGPRR